MNALKWRLHTKLFLSSARSHQCAVRLNACAFQNFLLLEIDKPEPKMMNFVTLRGTRKIQMSKLKPVSIMKRKDNEIRSHPAPISQILRKSNSVSPSPSPSMTRFTFPSSPLLFLSFFIQLLSLVVSLFFFHITITQESCLSLSFRSFLSLRFNLYQYPNQSLGFTFNFSASSFTLFSLHSVYSIIYLNSF